MTLGQMISRIRRQLPAATVESVSDSDITNELNHGVDECNLIAQVFWNTTTINLAAEQQTYSLSVYVPGYLGLMKSGVWYFNSSGTSKYLFAKTLRWFDLYQRNWRDLTSGEPTWYWIEKDELGLYPKPSESNTLKVYHLKQATAMTANDNYPWNNTTSELTSLRAFDNAIIAYAKWKLSPAVGKDDKEDFNLKEFQYEVTKASQQVKRRRDLMSDYDYYMRVDGMRM